MIVEGVYVTTVILAISSWAQRVVDGASTNINKRQAEILCAIYNSASSPPTETFNRGELDKVTAEIDTINASLASEDWFNEIEGALKDSKVTEEVRKRYGVDEQGWSRWQRAVGKVLEPNSPYSKIPVENPEARLAQIRMNKIESQVAKVLQDIQSKNVEARLEEIKNKFNQAISGDGKGGTANEATVVFTTTDNRVNACGKADGSKGLDAGKNLILDFMCLCAWEVATDGAGDACFGEENPVGKSEDFNTFDDQPTKINAMWATVKGECKKQEAPPKADANFLRDAIAQFLRELDESTAATSTSLKAGMLGSLFGAGGTGCDGKYTSQGGPCVMYAKKAGVREYEIGWMGPLKAGLKHLEIAEVKTRAIHDDIKHLSILLANAQLIYAEAKAASETQQTTAGKITKSQTKSQSQNPSTLADKTTGQEATAVGTATIPRFILPWTLLI